MSSNSDKTTSASSLLQKLATVPLLCDVLEKQVHEESESRNRTMNYNKHTSQTHSFTNWINTTNYNNSHQSNDRHHNVNRRHSLPAWQRSHPEMGSDTHFFNYQQAHIQSIMHPVRNNLYRSNSVSFQPITNVTYDTVNTRNYPPTSGVISHLDLESKHIEQTREEVESKNSNSRLSLNHSQTNIIATKSEDRKFPKETRGDRILNTLRSSTVPAYHEKGIKKEWESDSDSVFTPTTFSVTDTAQDNQKLGLKRRLYSETTPGFNESSYSTKKMRRVSGPAMLQPPQSHLPREGSRRSTSPRPVELPFTLDTLTKEIIETCKNNTQSSDSLQKKQTLRSVLENIFRQQFPGCSLHLVGSSVNGFGNKSSDADFCLLLMHWREIDQRFEARKILLRLNKLLQHCHFVEDSQVIFATVPIIKFVDSVSKCECDININNLVGIRNTFLLKAYCKTDERVCPLVMVVKKWAKTHGINDSKGGTLSSYALTLMVIHYLQCGCSPPVLPSLQKLVPDVFRDGTNVNNLLKLDVQNLLQQNSISRSQNLQSLGELLLGFFQYFANHFSWDISAISVRLGQTCNKEFGKMKNKYMYIEEPFDSNNVAKTVYDLANFNKIKMKISLAANKLKVSPSLESIL